MFDLTDYAIIAATFLVAGAIKGVVGLGLPTVALAVFTVTLGLHSAMALLIVPSLVTNAWQAAVGGHGRQVLARIWPFLLAVVLAIMVGTEALTRVDLDVLTVLLGTLIVLYAVFGLTRPAVSLPGAWEIWCGPLAGLLNGVFTGMTGSFVMPGLIYLQALGFKRDALVQAMGLLFLVCTVGLLAALGVRGLLTPELSTASAAGVLPALAGMELGRRLRRRLSEDGFRRVLYVALLLLGVYIAGSAVLR